MLRARTICPRATDDLVGTLMTKWLAIWMLVASAVTAVLYAWDKRAAVKGRSRIAEKTLLIWCAAGGWPGGLITSKVFRHKTQKISYRIMFWLAVGLNLLVIGGLLYLQMNREIE